MSRLTRTDRNMLGQLKQPDKHKLINDADRHAWALIIESRVPLIHGFS